MVSKPFVFAREATGIVRQWNISNVWQYGLVSMGILNEGGLLWLMGPAVFPGANVTYTLIIAMVWGVLSTALVYSMLTSTFPRTGAEFVWQSRLLHPSIAFAQFFALQLFGGAWWPAVNVWWLRNFFWTPMLVYLGYLWHNPGLIALGTQAADPNFIFVLTLAFNSLMLALLIPNIRWFLKIQLAMAFGYLAAIVAIIGLLASATPASFQAALNSFMMYFNQPNFYQKVIQMGSSQTDLNPPFSWSSTLGLLPIAWWCFGWPLILAPQMGGEIKGVNNLKRLFGGIGGIMLLVAASLVIIGFELYHLAGSEFINALSYLWFNGKLAGITPTDPYFALFSVFFTSSFAIIFIVFFFNIVVACFANTTNTALQFIRQSFAVGFDRVLPTWFTNLNKRFNTPTNGLFAYWVWSSIATALASYTSIMNYFLALGFMSMSAMLLSCLSGVVLPFRMRDVFRGSPASRYRIGGMPMISLLGAAGLAFLAVMSYYILTVPALGISYTLPLIILGGLYVAGFITYWIIRAIQKSRGINIDLAFKEVPPE